MKSSFFNLLYAVGIIILMIALLFGAGWLMSFIARQAHAQFSIGPADKEGYTGYADALAKGEVPVVYEKQIVYQCSK